jgi:hypothetical protein
VVGIRWLGRSRNGRGQLYKKKAAVNKCYFFWFEFYFNNQKQLTFEKDFRRTDVVFVIGLALPCGVLI